MTVWSEIVIGLFVVGFLYFIFDILAYKYMIRKKSKKSCYCWCPKCDNELISSGSFISDEEIVIYKCAECGEVSKWYFDTPAPILIEDK